MIGIKYEYMLHTWGGFYNDEFKSIHGHIGGSHYFDTKQKRENYLDMLQGVSDRLNAKCLVSTLEEGYHTRTPVVAHRVSSFKGETYHTIYDFPPCYPYDVALYHLENKWYVGFNDYPLGEDFDYDSNDVKVEAEWITGAFDIKE